MKEIKKRKELEALCGKTMLLKKKRKPQDYLKKDFVVIGISDIQKVGKMLRGSHAVAG